MKKIVCVVFAAVLAVCSSFALPAPEYVKPFSVKELKNSNASKFIKSSADLKSYNSLSMKAVYDDPIFEAYASDEKMQNDFSDVLESLGEYFTSYGARVASEVEDKYDEFWNEVTDSMSVDLSVNIPNRIWNKLSKHGINIEVPASKGSLKLTRNGDTVDAVFDVDLQMVTSFDPVKFCSAVSGESMYKDFKISFAVGCVIKSNFTKDLLDDFDDLSGFDDVMNYCNSCTVDAQSIMYAGSSVCVEDFGGKGTAEFVIKLNTPINANVIKKFSEGFEDVMSLLNGEKVSAKRINAMPLSVSLSADYFDDDGNFTYNAMKASSFYEMLESIQKLQQESQL